MAKEQHRELISYSVTMAKEENGLVITCAGLPVIIMEWNPANVTPVQVLALIQAAARHIAKTYELEGANVEFMDMQ